MPSKIIKLHPSISVRPHKTNHQRRFANFVPQGLPRLWTHYYVAFRHFAKEYSLPLILTIIFLVFVGVAMLFRSAQHASLANLLAGVTVSGQDYGTLLSKDKTDELKKNTDNNQPTTDAPAGTATSFAINTGTNPTSTTAPISSGGGSGTVPVTPAAFAASIAYFQRDNTELECTTPKPKQQTCSKRYTFSAGIRTQNGPGNVSYGWRSNLQGVVEDNNVAVGGGAVLTPIQKVVVIACSSASSFSLQMNISSPTLTQSAVINTDHNCNEI